MRREMLAHIRDLGGEAQQVAAEPCKAGPAVALDQMILNEVKRPFDFALRPGPPDAARPGFDPVVAAQLQKVRIPFKVRRAGSDDERARVIDQSLFGDTAEVPERLFEGLVDRRRGLIATRPVELT